MEIKKTNIHPSTECEAGQLRSSVTVDTLRQAIPSYCFKPLYRYAFYYLVRDLVLAAALYAAAFLYIPLIKSDLLRISAWLLYGYSQDLVLTGVWVLGHECGHSAFSPSETLNHVLGFTLHASLLTPYFAWRSTHRRHHIYANNLTKDHNYVPPRKEEYFARLNNKIDRLGELTEDSPFFTLLRIILQQVSGWPWYLITNITAAPGSLIGRRSTQLLGNSHFLPWSSLFRREEAYAILASDVGILVAAFSLREIAHAIGWYMLGLLYFMPWLWVNHWIVAITYLHHTHPQIPKFEDEAWSFLKGAIATVDRDFGWVGKFLFHNIIEYHIIHHLFPRIPFYYGEEATRAIRPLLGKFYHEDRNRSFLPALYESFTQCQYVEAEDESLPVEKRVMVYKGGPSPSPVFRMGF